jgi:apolipoprotein N-acyltransferase
MKKPAGIHAFFGFAAGLLLMTPHFFPALAPLQAAALLPVLYVAASPAFRRRRVAAAGLFMGLAYTLPQVTALRLPVAISLLLVAYLGAILVLFAWLSSYLLRGPAVAGAIAVGTLFALLDWINFTLVPIWGTAQSFARPWSYYPGLISFVSVTGITGILFALGSMQGFLINIYTQRRRRLSLAAGLVGVVLFFGALDLVPRYSNPVGSLRVAAIGWTHRDSRKLGGVDGHEGFQALFAGPAAEAAARGARLVVSPETAFVFDGTISRRDWLERFRALAREHGVFLVIGYFDETQDLNRLFFMDPDGFVEAEYTKTFLTPFEKYRRGDGSTAVVRIPGYAVGGMICQDDNFTRLSRAYGQARTSIVAVPTNDWRTVKEAHFQSSIFRAVESRYAVVRAATDGISAVISPEGRVLAKKDHLFDGPGFVTAEVPLYRVQTVFSRLGHWPAALSLAFLMIYGAWLIRRSFLSGS